MDLLLKLCINVELWILGTTFIKALLLAVEDGDEVTGAVSRDINI